jgi:hypothetical protein
LTAIVRDGTVRYASVAKRTIADNTNWRGQL